MPQPKLIRITTIPLSLEKLLEGQLSFMSNYYDVIAISSEPERLLEIGKKEKINTFSIPLTRKITPINDLICIFKLYLFLRKERPLIVHTHTPKAGFIGMVASYLARVPIRLHTVAGLPLMEASGFKGKILILIEKLTYKLTNKIYPNSKGLHEFIVTNKLTRPKKSKVLGNGSSNGIDTSWFSKSNFSIEEIENFRKELKIPSNDIVFLFVGRLVKDKGINELVESFQRLSKEHQNCSLLLVGPFEDHLDPLTESTKKDIIDHEKIFTTGYQSDVRKYYALSDILVFPSYREGFPNVVLQAGAMGMPSIVTDINGCNEIIEHEANGIIIEKKNAAELYMAMKNLYENIELRGKLSDNSRKMIIDRFEQKEFWNILLNEYRSLQ